MRPPASTSPLASARAPGEVAVNLRRSSALPLGLVLPLLLLTACGPKTAEPVAGISIRVLPTSATLLPGQTRTFSATVGGTRDSAIQWSIEGGELPGTITSDGLYTAPEVPGVYTLIVTSGADRTKSARATLTVQSNPGVVVKIEGGDIDLRPNQTHDFAALVSGTDDKAVVWSIDEPNGGSIDSDGLYVAPLVVGTYTVRATSTVDPARSGTAKAYVVPRELSGTVSYAGGKTGRVYLAYGRNPFTNALGGTSIEGPGQFTIKGLRGYGHNSTQRVFAYMDVQGTGTFNAAVDPRGMAEFTFEADGVANVAVTLEEPSTIAPPSPTNVKVVGGADGAFVTFDVVRLPISSQDPDSLRVEAAESYRVYWSELTQPGPNEHLGFLEVTAGNAPVIAMPKIAAPATYAFSVTSVVSGVESEPSAAVAGVVVGPGAATDRITGAVELEGFDSVGTIYVVLATESGDLFQVQQAQLSGTSATYAFSGVPAGNWRIHALQDTDDDGTLETIEPRNSESPTLVTKLEGAEAIAPASVLTFDTFRTPVLTGYTRYDVTTAYTTLYITARPANRMPVRVEVLEGPWLSVPAGLAPRLSNPGGFMINAELRGAPPAGTTYTLEALFEDGTSEQRQSEPIILLTDLPQPTAPSGATVGVTPTFTWSAPEDDSDRLGVHVYRVAGQNWVPVWTRVVGADETSVVFNDDGTATEALSAGASYAWFMDRADAAGNYGYDLGAARSFSVQ